MALRAGLSPIDLSLWRQYLSDAAEGIEATGRGIVQVDVAFVAWVAIIGAVAIGARHARSAPMFVLMAAGAVWFYATLATQRSDNNNEAYAADAARYVHVASILLLPCFALMADTVLRWRREASAAIAVLVVAMTAGNVVEHARWNDTYVGTSREIRRQIEATVALGNSYRRSTRPTSLRSRPSVRIHDRPLACDARRRTRRRAAPRTRRCRR